MSLKRKVLVVEDNRINRMILCGILAPDYHVLEAENGLEALKVLKEHGEEVSLILLDILMPVMDGYTFLSRVKADSAYSSIPVIVITQSDGESDEVTALSHGAADFVAKPYKPQIILHRVASIINLRETAAMINLIQYDRLTGLYSKEFFYQRVKEILIQHPDKEYDIICSDIVNFKLINDIFGVQAGDQLLCGIADLYSKGVGDRGICGHFNADQFACLLERSFAYTDEQFIKGNARINALSSAKNIVMKWGIYSIADRTIPVEQMCDRALLAARSLKTQYGKYFAVYDDELRSRLLREQAITDSMEPALAEGQFVIYLQPKYRIRDNRMAGAEALVRWIHPEWGFQSPAQFIPLFERNGFITKLDQFVWRQSCAVMREWDDKGYPLSSVSVNVSRADIYNADLAEILVNTVREYGLEPSRLHLEITESAYTEDPEQIVETVGHLRELGFVIEMDDFGSGYSSLNMLNDMPVDILKLDMKFIQSETAKPASQGILRFIMELARWMKLSVVAEGVETSEQLERLRDIGCDYVQGYYFAKPMPCGEFEALVKEQHLRNEQGETDGQAVADNGPGEPEKDLCCKAAPEGGINLSQELLNACLPGGMMGGYMEEGFPFYFVNRRMLEYLGYENEKEFVDDIEGLISNCMHPEDRRRVDAEVDTQLKNREEYTVEYRMKKKNGSYIWVHDVGRRVKAEDGRPAIISVCLDITDEKKLHGRIRELYEKELTYFAELSSAEGNIQGSLNVTKGILETYLSTSEAAVAHVGDTYEETIENLAASAVDWERGREIRNALSRDRVLADYAAGKVDYHFEFLRRSNAGGIFWESTNLRTCQEPETGDILLFFYTLDVTEKKLQEQLLGRILELDYELITEINIESDTQRPIVINGSREDLMIPREGGFHKEMNYIADRFLEGASRREYLEKLDYDYMKDQLERRDEYTFIVEMRDGQGNVRVKRLRVFYISKEMGRVCVARTDVTDIVLQEQRQKEELAAALIAAEQANAAKSDFLSRMSHEIRTPMNAIIGMSTIAAQSIGDDEQVEDCISKIGISSRFLLSLINDILDMSRIESGKMLLKNEKIPTEEFINGINSICYAQAAARGVEYECIVDPVLDDYYIGDAMKLQQVLINILSNAVKFTGEGGKVTFSASQRRKNKNDAVIRFIVNDTGVGMSEEFLPHIFEPFSQESTGTTSLYGGTGLGLAISKNIVDMMDGKIAVRSIKGIGTEFTVDVKLGITEEEKLRHNQKKQTYNFSHLKTLVVDDDVAVCESAVVTLREMGISAEWVDSGRKAIDRVQEFWNQRRYYDLILIDWKMPDMDGIETARRIRSIVGPEVTIIIMTAYDWISIEHEAKMAGVNLLMSKPMFKSSLVSAFSRAFGEKEEEKQQEEITEYDFTGKRVLLVEDNLINTEVAVMLLKCRGFEVDTAENGLRALEVFSKSEEGYYNAILMDIRMPLMDGLTAAMNIRHLSNADAGSIPIIAMTANAFDDDIEKSKAAGMNAHLAKPIEPTRLYQTLYDFIYGKEA